MRRRPAVPVAAAPAPAFLRAGAAVAVICLLSPCGSPLAAPAAPATLPAAAPSPPDAAVAGPQAQPGSAWRDPATGIEFVLVPGGAFTMGSNGLANEGPPHEVRISAFWLARTEVTQAQWRAVVGTNPSGHERCDDCPVEQVSWEDVQGFLLRTGYLLPTETQWEYAAGGGAAHQRWAGTDNLGEIGEFAWYLGNSGNRTHPVGGKKPNRFGLHDMSGNVYEWCGDWYAEDYYRRSPAADPPGPSRGTSRVARGGSWILDPRIAGVTFRLKALPHRRRRYIGFRPVLPGGPR